MFASRSDGDAHRLGQGAKMEGPDAGGRGAGGFLAVALGAARCLGALASGAAEALASTGAPGGGSRLPATGVGAATPGDATGAAEGLGLVRVHQA